MNKYFFCGWFYNILCGFLFFVGQRYKAERLFMAFEQISSVSISASTLSYICKYLFININQFWILLIVKCVFKLLLTWIRYWKPSRWKLLFAQVCWGIYTFWMNTTGFYKSLAGLDDQYFYKLSYINLYLSNLSSLFSFLHILYSMNKSWWS